MRFDFRNGWLVVFGSALGLTVSVAPLQFQSFAIFLKPLAAEFGAPRSAVAAAAMVGNLGLILGTLLAGWLVDRLGARIVIACSAALLSLAMASLWFSQSLAMFIVLFGVTAFLGCGQTAVPYADVVSTWFDRRRGLALGLAIGGVGIGGTVIPQIARSFIEDYGWRGAYVGLAIVSFLVAQAAVILFIRQPAGTTTRHKQKTAQEGLPGLTAKEARVTGLFWQMSVAMFLVVMVIIGVNLHLVALLTDKGASTINATAVLSVVGISQFAGRLVAGYLCDKFHAPKVAVAFFSAPIIGLLILIFGAHSALPFIAAALVGLALGAEMDFMAFMVSRYFGLRSFGEIFGYMFAIFNLGAALGPILMAVSFDITGSYDPALIGFAISLAVAALMMSRIGAYIYPPVETRTIEKAAPQTQPA